MSMNAWLVWSECHESPEQKKRAVSAASAECTPVSLDVGNAAGTFSGSHGVYQTGLSGCSCMDFSRRSLPCKHMYRLAMELGAMEGAAVADARKVKAPHPIDSLSLSALVAKIEELPASTQLVLKEFLLEALFRKAEVVGYMPGPDVEALLDAGLLERVEVMPDLFVGVELLSLLSAHGVSGYRKNASLASLVKWCRDNVGAASVVLPELVCVELSPGCKKRARPAYSYLMRKYDTEEYVDEEANVREIPKGASYRVAVSAGETELSLVFPDDEVTVLLDKYGANRCPEWIAK